MNRLESTWLAQIRRRGDGVAGARVLVACSGGGDSMALLAFLCAAGRSLGLADLAVAHANHGLREASAGDADFVRDFCRQKGLDLAEASLDVTAHSRATGQGVETAARELRWGWLKAEAAAMDADLVATGHTLDDHTETVLVRLSRGSGAGVLTPLEPMQGLRWSPLIEVRRPELRDYLGQKQLSWREDATNALGFTPRNRWRKLLEGMRSEAPALDRHLWETHRQVAELEGMKDGLVREWRGGRWQRDESGLRLKAPLAQAELRWILEAACHEAGWQREAVFLQDLAAWMRPHLERKLRKSKTWGTWTLEASPSPWSHVLRPGSR